MKKYDVYIYKETVYQIRGFGNMKVDTEKDGDYESKSEWIEAVIYTPLHDQAKIFIRSKFDFESKFTKRNLP